MSVLGRPVVLAAGVALLAAGCGSAAKKATSGTPPVPPATSAAGSSAQASPSAANPSFSGIVLDSCSNGFTQTITAYDPASGQVTGTRSFITRPENFHGLGCTDTLYGPAIRGQFNADYTQMAVTIDLSPEQHVGYVTGSDTLHDLTPPKGTSFSSTTPMQTAPFFNPKTGRLWFETPDGYGSVDPAAGASSSRPEKANGQARVPTPYFTSAGNGPLLGDATGYQYPDSPDGQLVAARYTGSSGHSGYNVAGPGTDLSTAPELPGPDCTPYSFVDNSRFLCLADAQLYLVTLNASRTAATTTALLPASSRHPLSALVDPTGRTVAFVAAQDGTDTLYVTGLGGQSEPHKVTDWPDSTGNGDGGVLLGWTQ